MEIEHKNARSMSPSQKQINILLKCYEKGQLAQAEELSLSITRIPSTRVWLESVRCDLWNDW